MDTLLATSQWQTFTQRFWRVQPARFEYAPRGDGGPTLRAIAYADRKGRLRLPAYQPHLPLDFTSTPTSAAYRIERQWLETARLLVDDMIAQGIDGEVTFSPAVVDLRPWMWSWFRVTPRFTNYIDFPFTMSQADRVARQQAAKASRAGFICIQAGEPKDALACLSESEARGGFDYGMTVAGLEMARELLGPESLRIYVCHAPDGKPATARIVLHRRGGRACDWLAGTTNAHLRSGATQLLISYMLADLETAGASGYNSCGADLESVAHAKATWGGRLVPQYSIQAYDFRPMKHLLGNMVRFRRRRAAVRKSKNHNTCP